MFGWFSAAAETRELGLVVKKKGVKKIKEDWEADSLQYKKRQDEDCIIKNTSWVALEFELGYSTHQKLLVVIWRQTETSQIPRSRKG